MSPSRRTIALLSGWLLLGVAASLAPALGAAWLATGAALAVAVGVDALRVSRAPLPAIERTVPAAFSMGVWTPARLAVENRARRAISLALFDHHPPAMRAEGLPARLRLEPETRAEHSYRLWPESRGDHGFGPVELRIRAPFGLVERHARAGEAQTVRAYPNFRAATGYELLAVENRTGALGIRRRPRRGEGLEFHQLREYRAGDSLRQVDWKATARLRRTISREYQDQRDQQLIFLLDCGRRLHTKDGERSHFDAALDAVLLLAQVALRQGDAFGLMTFAGERRWLAPRKGVAHLNALLNAVYDLETGPRVADYGVAARDLALRVRKRSLVVLISNLRDEDAEELNGSLRLLSRRHLVLLASLKEGVLDAALQKPVERLEDALRVSAVHLYLEQRQRTLRRLNRSGALLLESEAADLPVALVNRYLDVKSAGVL